MRWNESRVRLRMLCREDVMQDGNKARTVSQRGSLSSDIRPNHRSQLRRERYGPGQYGTVVSHFQIKRISDEQRVAMGR
jgi:hypothetical protein